MTSLISFVVDSDTCGSKMQMELSVVFPWQHWIRVWVTILYVHCLTLLVSWWLSYTVCQRAWLNTVL